MDMTLRLSFLQYTVYRQAIPFPLPPANVLELGQGSNVTTVDSYGRT